MDYNEFEIIDLNYVLGMIKKNNNLYVYSKKTENPCNIFYPEYSTYLKSIDRGDIITEIEKNGFIILVDYNDNYNLLKSNPVKRVCHGVYMLYDYGESGRLFFIHMLNETNALLIDEEYFHLLLEEDFTKTNINFIDNL